MFKKKKDYMKLIIFKSVHKAVSLTRRNSIARAFLYYVTKGQRFSMYFNFHTDIAVYVRLVI
jgi:hypothetical protein